MMERVLAPLHGIVPPLDAGIESCYFRRVVRFFTPNSKPRAQAAVDSSATPIPTIATIEAPCGRTVAVETPT